MKTYLLDTFNRYKRYSEKLDAKTVLCNKCWWVFNDAGEKETYIFKEDGTIIITRSGAVTYGKWEYIPVNQSVIISGNNQSFMVLPSFVDEYILALQVDGTNNFAFLIDEQNKSKFAPKTYQDVLGYFEEKERRAIEVEKLIIQRKTEKEAEEQKKKIVSLAEIQILKWKDFYFVLAGSFYLIFMGVGIYLSLLIPVPLLLGLSIVAVLVVPLILWVRFENLYIKMRIKKWLEVNPNDPINPFLQEYLRQK